MYSTLYSVDEYKTPMVYCTVLDILEVGIHGIGKFGISTLDRCIHGTVSILKWPPFSKVTFAFKF
jgi:hypothetical protein